MERLAKTSETFLEYSGWHDFLLGSAVVRQIYLWNGSYFWDKVGFTYIGTANMHGKIEQTHTKSRNRAFVNSERLDQFGHLRRLIGTHSLAASWVIYTRRIPFELTKYSCNKLTETETRRFMHAFHGRPGFKISVDIKATSALRSRCIRKNIKIINVIMYPKP